MHMGIPARGTQRPGAWAARRGGLRHLTVLQLHDFLALGVLLGSYSYFRVASRGFEMLVA